MEEASPIERAIKKNQEILSRRRRPILRPLEVAGIVAISTAVSVGARALLEKYFFDSDLESEPEHGALIEE